MVHTMSLTRNSLTFDIPFLFLVVVFQFFKSSLLDGKETQLYRFLIMTVVFDFHISIEDTYFQDILD